LTTPSGRRRATFLPMPVRVQRQPVQPRPFLRPGGAPFDRARQENLSRRRDRGL